MLGLAGLAACTLLAPPEIVVTGVTPEWGYFGERTEIEIRGERFFPAVVVDDAVDEGGRIQGAFEAWLQTDPPTALEDVQLTAYDRLSAEVPEGLTPGVYDVRVVAPSGDVATLPASFTVTDTRADHLGIIVGAAGWEVGTYVPLVLRLQDPEGDAVPQAMAVSLTATSETGATGLTFVPGGLDDEVPFEDEVGVTGRLGPDGEAIVLVTSEVPDDVTFTLAAVDDPVVDPDSVLLSWDPGSIDEVEVALPRTEFRTVAGEPFDVRITLRDEFGNELPSDTARVILIDECTDWWSAVTVNGSVTTEVMLTAACESDVLHVITTEGQWSSSPFTVLPADPVGYTLEPTPTSVTAGESALLLAVHGVDVYGNVVSDLDGTVRLADDVGGLDPARSVGLQTCPGFPPGDEATQVCTVALWVASDAVTLTATDQQGRSGVSPPITVVANVATQLMVTSGERQVAAGEPFEVVVRLVDDWGNDVAFDPNGADPVSFEDDTGTVACTWSAESTDGHVFDCTVEAAHPGDEVRATVGALDGVLPDPMVVTNAALALVEIEPLSPPFTAGQTFEMVVRGFDAYGNAYMVQTDPSVELADTTGTLDPAVVALGGNGEGTVSASITRAATGIVVTGSQGGTAMGASAPFTVAAAEAASLSVTAPPWLVVGEVGEVTVTVVDAHGNATPGYSGTVTVATVSGVCDPTVIDDFDQGSAVATLSCTSAALSEQVTAEDADGLYGETGWLDVLDFACADGPSADLTLDGDTELLVCTTGGTATVAADASASVAGNNGVVLYHFVDSEGTAERTTSATSAFTWTGEGIRVVELVVADRLACADAVEAVAYVGADDGDATGPITVTPSASTVTAGGTVRVAVAAVDCKGDVADLATVRLRADLGTVAGTSTGDGLEATLDAAGEAEVDWTFGEAFATTATLHVASADGGAYGAAEVTTTQDGVRPTVVSMTPSGRIVDDVSTITVVFTEPMYTTNLSAATVQLAGPSGTVGTTLSMSADLGTLTITPTWPVHGADGTFALTLSSNVRDRAGNRIDGAWSGSASSFTGTFGAVVDSGPTMSSCTTDLSLFRPDGDPGAAAEADEVTMTPLAATIPDAWSWSVVDDTGAHVRSGHADGTVATLAWDGRGDDGRVVASGDYTMRARAVDAQGNHSPWCEAAVQVDHVVEAP